MWAPLVSRLVTVTLWLALVLQLVSLALLRLGLGKGWLRRPVTLLVLASVACDGLAPVLLSSGSVRQWDPGFTGLAPGYADEAALILAAGMLAFTAAYLAGCPARGAAPAAAGDGRQAARVLEWRVLALACVPLAALTYAGRGYNSATGITGAPAPDQVA